jgi:hypothetical protein
VGCDLTYDAFAGRPFEMLVESPFPFLLATKNHEEIKNPTD